MATHQRVVPRICQTHARQRVEEVRRETFYRIVHLRAVNCQPASVPASVLAKVVRAKTVRTESIIAQSDAPIWQRVVPPELTTGSSGKVIGKYAMLKFVTRSTLVIRTAVIGTTIVSGELIRTHGGGSARASIGGDRWLGPR